MWTFYTSPHFIILSSSVMMNFPPMPLLPISSATTINACKSLPLRPTDVFICSYPKSGTTWTQHIVLTLLLASRRCHPSPDDDEILSGYNHVSEYAPFFEIDAHWDHNRHCLIESIQRNHDALHQRVFNTHLRWEMLPKQMSNEEDNNDHLRPACGKFIYVTRNLPEMSVPPSIIICRIKKRGPITIAFLNLH